jgi:hypothetical protein
MDRQQELILGLQISDWIAIADILVTTIIGIWIAISVQNNLTKSRYLKEYFINEVKEIRDSYKSFITRLCKGELAAKYIKDWLKIMSERTQNLDKFLHDKYKIDNSLIVQKHAEIQKKITDFDEFNDNYKEKTVNFSSSSKNDIYKLHSELRCTLTQRVIDINNAKNRWKWLKK